MKTTNKILERVDWKLLNTYIDNKLIMANKHPEYDIWILNYSVKVQGMKAWDEYTLSCRGLVIDAEGNILARPFEKFMNYEEYLPTEIDWSLDFDAFEKMDGSLIILFYYKSVSKWIVASRGSFISEQALEAQKMLDVSVYDALSIHLTYLFEILYPENRIVIDYGKRKELVLLAIIETASGFEVPYERVMKTYLKYFNVVKRFEIKTFKELQEVIERGEDNKEGFVIRFINGFRLKMKFAEYCRLHAIVTNVSNLTIWEHLKNNYDFDELLDRVPDEFYDWLKKTVHILKKAFDDVECQALMEYGKIYPVKGTDRRTFAIEALKTKYSAILFKMYDKKPYDDLIWKIVRPIYSKPFKDGFEVQDFEAEVL
jgi:T4 RnlA family RNA ligase